MLADLNYRQVLSIRHEYNQLKTQELKEAYIDQIVDSVYEKRHQLYDFWEIEKEAKNEKAPVEKMPNRTIPTKSNKKIIGVKNCENTNKKVK
tara:strand:+ start:816 stop:1091 length:276 start_codon:yes stop_codon:yes gene_type:complete